MGDRGGALVWIRKRSAMTDAAAGRPRSVDAGAATGSVSVVSFLDAEP